MTTQEMPRTATKTSTGTRPRRLGRRTMATTAACAAAAGLVLSTSTAAHASGPYYKATSADLGVRLTVCANTLGVRYSPGGTPFGYLSYPQTFTVEGFSTSEWVYGLAYGGVGQHGWVQNGWFC